MPRFLISFLIAAIVFLATTFAGMTVLGMQGGMEMDSHGVPCVERCLDTAASMTTTVTPAVFVLLAFIVLFLFVFPDWISGDGPRVPTLDRWREGIGKRLRHQQLATVILRN